MISVPCQACSFVLLVCLNRAASCFPCLHCAACASLSPSLLASDYPSAAPHSSPGHAQNPDALPVTPACSTMMTTHALTLIHPLLQTLSTVTLSSTNGTYELSPDALKFCCLSQNHLISTPEMLTVFVENKNIVLQVASAFYKGSSAL